MHTGLSEEVEKMAEAMVSRKAGEGAAPEAVSQIVPRVESSEYKEALNAIREKSLEDASPTVFNFLQGSAPVEEKYSMVDAFVFKYGKTESPGNFGTGNPVLDELLMHASATFSTDFSILELKELEKKDPERLSYMQALAYGFAKCGHAGFRAAVDMVAGMDSAKAGFYFPGFSGRITSLAAPFANMVCCSLVKSGRFDSEKAVGDITLGLKKPGLSALTRAALINLVRIVDPLSLPSIVKDAQMDEDVKHLAASVMKAVVMDPDTPGHIKEALKSRAQELREDGSLDKSVKDALPGPFPKHG